MSIPRTTGPAAPGERTPKKKAGGARRTRQKQRVTKKTGDVRNKPDTREDGTPKRKLGPVTGAGIRYLTTLLWSDGDPASRACIGRARDDAPL